MASLFKGTIGAGFYILPFSFLLGFLILLLHDGRPVALRVTCAFLLAATIGALAHVFSGGSELEWSWEMFGDYLTANVAGTGVQAVQDDILTYYNRLPSGGADLIISNPPYLTAEEMAHLMPETAREPAMALDGGADGLDFYRLLTAHYRDALRPGGWLVLEIGCAQAADVLALGAANGWVNGSCRKDYGSNDRAVLLQKPEKSC